MIAFLLVALCFLLQNKQAATFVTAPIFNLIYPMFYLFSRAISVTDFASPAIP